MICNAQAIMNVPSATVRKILLSDCCRAICYHILRSAHIQIVRWCLHQYPRELIATVADAEVITEWFNGKADGECNNHFLQTVKYDLP